MTATNVHRTIEAVWRIESAKVVAGIARTVGDAGVAEELAQDALVAALEQWPESGIPQKQARGVAGILSANAEAPRQGTAEIARSNNSIT